MQFTRSSAYRFTAEELAMPPTLAIGQHGGVDHELKREGGGHRVWLAGSEVVVEQYTGGIDEGWIETDPDAAG